MSDTDDLAAITLPASGWTPRPYQQGIWNYLANGGRNAVACWHRRAGKDDLALHHTACAMHERVGSYLHLLPKYSQARKALWTQINSHSGKRRIDEAFPKELRASTLEDEMFIRFKNGSTWQLAGSDSYDSIVGSSYCGLVHSEYALADPAAQSYFQPILIENKGWQIFISTPRGKNHMYGMYQHALKQMNVGKDWFAELMPASKSNALDKEMLMDELERLMALHGSDFGRALFLQEFEVSFDAAIPGSIFGEWIFKARQTGRIGTVPIEPNVPVCTAWDLGRTDATAIWWFQIALGSVRVIDYYEDNFKDVAFYGDILRERAKERGFTYDTHYLPRDAKQQHMAAGGDTVHKQMIRQDVGRIQIVNSQDHIDGIQAARATLPMCWFDAVRCEKGIAVLENYHYVWDDEAKCFANKPEHDWSSHGASAFRTLSLAWKSPKSDRRGKETAGAGVGLQDTVRPVTFGEAKRRHLRAKRAERNESY